MYYKKLYNQTYESQYGFETKSHFIMMHDSFIKKADREFIFIIYLMMFLVKVLLKISYKII